MSVKTEQLSSPVRKACEESGEGEEEERGGGKVRKREGGEKGRQKERRKIIQERHGW